MRKFLCLAVFAPALVAAQDAKGPCPGAVGPDSALQGFTAKPDRKPRRKQDGIVPQVQDATFTVSTPEDEDRNVSNGSMAKIVILVGVVDTTGKLMPTSLAITQSPSGALTQAVCAAALQMAFVPAEKAGQKVPGEYKERFAFYRSHVDNNAPRGSRP
jgi:hypothetical protein